MERPDYIPFFRHIVDHDSCTNLDAVVYGYIYWLTKLRNEMCFASNDRLAQFAKTTPGSIENSLTSLERAGFITRIYIDNNPHKGRLEIIPLLLVGKLPPPGGRMSHPQVGDVPPTGGQSESIELEQTTGDVKHRFEIVEDEDKPQKKDKHTKEIQEVFFLFSPRKELWMKHKTQRESAFRLHHRGIDKLKRGIEIMDEYVDKFCPQAHTPWQYEQKLPALNAFVKKHGL